MTTEEIEAWAKRYLKDAREGSQGGPFTAVKKLGRNAENFEAYALKTVVKRLIWRKLPMTDELMTAFQADDEIETSQSKIERELSQSSPEGQDDAIWEAVAAEADASIEKHIAEEASNV